MNERYTRTLDDTYVAHVDGLEVRVSRSKQDGRLVVDIDSSGVADNDQYANGVPKLRLWINEAKIELSEDGDLVEL